MSPDNDVYEQLTVGSLFSGIGGLDLGLERAGMRVIWQSENDSYASRVLAKHWPHVPNLGDVTKIDWSDVERPDLVCGGFPCQPFSSAGQRRGPDDPRHLWPHFAACLRLLRPPWALLENVPGILTLGFGEVAADLADLGYSFEWECLPAAAVGAPHLRWRVFVVAHTSCGRHESQPRCILGDEARPHEPQHRDEFGRGGPHVADSGSVRRDGGASRHEPRVAGEHRIPAIGREGVGVAAGSGGARDVADPARSGQAHLQGCSAFPERPGRRTVDRAGWWDVEPDVGRVADGVPHRVDRLRTLGNAVVPQVAEYVGRLIVEAAQ